MTNRILISAAGTGGHVIPALSVAHELVHKGYEVHWLGTPHGIEQQLVAEHGIHLHSISITGLRGKGMRGLLSAPWRIIKATWQARKVIKKLKPQALIGFGGYVTGPAGVAAKLSGCPLAIHEQNAFPGMTNKWLKPLSQLTLQAFPGALPGAITCGNPVREAFHHIQPPPLERQRLHVLVVGGSLGAMALNKVVFETMQSLSAEDRPVLVHQVGKNHLPTLSEQYRQAGIEAKVCDFINDMPGAYADADLIVCRAGALTVSEVAAAGRAAIFVPFPYAVDDHQTANANSLAKQGAAELIAEKDLTVTLLRQRLQYFQQHREQLIDLAQQAKNNSATNATSQVVEHLEKMIRG